MKKIFLILGLFPIFGLNAQNSDYQLIEKTLNYYLDGGTNNDFETLKKAFHTTAIMRSSFEEYKEVNAIDFFEKAMKPGPKAKRKTSIAFINVNGNAACARLEIEYPKNKFVDFMNLLKINGEWKIVSKIFYAEDKYNGE